MEFTTKNEAKNKGFKTFNDCQHLCIDLNGAQTTISVNMPNGEQATFCFMPDNSNGYQCIDIDNQRDNQNWILFGKGPTIYHSLSKSNIDKKVTLSTLLVGNKNYPNEG